MFYGRGCAERAKPLGRGEMGRSERRNEVKSGAGKCTANFGRVSE